MIVYFDENIPQQLADALDILESKTQENIKVFSTKRIFGVGKKDEELIPLIAEQDALLVTKDINIHRTKVQYELYRKYKLGMVFLRLPKNTDSYWQIVQLVIERWLQIKELAKKQKKPFALIVKTKGQIEVE